MSMKDKLLKKVQVNDFVEVYWGKEEHKHTGKVTDIDEDSIELVLENKKVSYVPIDSVKSFSILEESSIEDEITNSELKQKKSDESKNKLFDKDVTLPEKLVIVTKYWHEDVESLMISRDIIEICNKHDSSKMLSQKLTNCLNKLSYAIKIHELDYKYGRLLPVIKDVNILCNIYKLDLLYELLAILMIKANKLYIDLFHEESQNKFILMANACICQKQSDFKNMTKYINSYYIDNPINDENIDNFIYSIHYLFVYKYDRIFYIKFNEIKHLSEENENRFRYVYDLEKHIMNSPRAKESNEIKNLEIKKEVKNEETIINIVAYLQKEVTRLVYLNDFKRAYKLVEQYFNKDPNNDQLADLLQYVGKVKNNFQKLDYQLPKNNSYYARALREWHIYENIKEAEKYFSKSINAKEDRFMSAILDYVDMIFRNNKDPNKALKLLLSYNQLISRESVECKIKYTEKLCSLYDVMKDSDHSLQCLKELKSLYKVMMDRNKKTSDYTKYKAKYGGTVQRIAFWLNRNEKYEEAIETAKDALRINNNVIPCMNVIVSSYLAMHKFDLARATIYKESYNLSYSDRILMQEKIDNFERALQESNADKNEILEIDDNMNLHSDKFISYYESTCLYEGIKEEQKQAGQYTLEDLTNINNIAKHTSTAKPKDKAAHYLSAALIEKSINNMSTEYYASLSNSFLFNGQFLVTNRQFDSAKSCCLYAIRLANHNQPDYKSQVKKSIVNYFYSILKDPDINEREGLKIDNKIDLQLAKICGVCDNKYVLKDIIKLLNSCILFKNIFKNNIENCEKLKEQLFKFFDISTIDDLWDKIKEYEVTANGIINNWLNEIKLDKNLEKNLVQHFNAVKDCMYVSESDKANLEKLEENYKELLEYNEFADIDNKKRILNYGLNNLNDEIEDINDYPTDFSQSFLIKAINYITTNIKNVIKRLEEEYKPEITIHVPIDTIKPNNGDVSLSVTIKNEENKATARNIYLKILDLDKNELCPKKQIANKNLKGGSETYEIMHFQVLNDDAFTINIVLYYEDEEGNCLSQEKQVSISVDNEDFCEINNPYVVGKPVDDDSMFFGRDATIEQLSNGLMNDKIRCVVIWGQKRTGKTSIFNHLKKKIKNQFIVLNFSVGADITSEINFYRSVQSEFVHYLEDQNYDDELIDYYEDYPINGYNDFYNYITRINRKICKIENKELLLMIDEFTYIYKYIQDDKCSMNGTFMDIWKTMIEINLFKAALIGQDFMPDFIKAYPNQFQIGDSIKVSYLDEKSAIELIKNPILLPNGHSRFLENSEKVIFDWFSGQPYYLQKYCRKLVDYMNSELKQNYITIAVASKVKKILLQDVHIDFFDNLVGQDETEMINVLLKIVNSSDSIDIKVKINRLDLSEKEKLALEKLDDRGVVEYFKKDNRCCIKIPFFYEWLKTQY